MDLAAARARGAVPRGGARWARPALVRRRRPAQVPVLALAAEEAAEALVDLLSLHRSQPQWQGVQRNGHQRTSRYRDQGDHRKADRVPPGCRLVAIFELPGFSTAASGAPQQQPDALRKASATSYYKDKDALWVKVVSSGDAGHRRPWWWNQPPGQPVS